MTTGTRDGFCSLDFTFSLFLLVVWKLLWKTLTMRNLFLEEDFQDIEEPVETPPPPL